MAKCINEIYEQTRRDVAFRLRVIREYEGYSVADWGKKLGIPGGTVSLYESSKETPNLLYCYDCCNVAGLCLDDLVVLNQNEFIKKLFFG